jgi:4,5-DOPA dioxygenase extradiol
MTEAPTHGEKMPVLFIGHGSPMNIVADNDFTRSLSTLAAELPAPEAIMVISAHWLTNGTLVGCMSEPRTIHDFYGFPHELYEMSYPCPGAPEHARLAREHLGLEAATCDEEWGLDHASWSVFHHMYPDADVPVFELSLDYSFNDWHPKSLEYHYELAKRLAPLRSEGVLILGSGNLVHNLGLIDFSTDAPVYGWAREADETIRSCLVERKHEPLLEIETFGRALELAVPTLDHYLPMIYSIALQEDDEPLSFTFEGFQNGSISMRCFRIG